VLAAILRKEFFHTFSDEVHRLDQEDVPILIVWGREDKANPLRLGQDMHRILKSSRLEVLDNAGHVPNYECSDVFNRLALDFLQE
jgi:pimeloyl-[acyl-carrier protein] methyl ester esterase